MHIVLIGDSIFDNASYVGEGESVSNLLSDKFPNAQVTLFAIDGDVTTDVSAQLESFPENATHVFISCGGNDALRSVPILEKQATSVGDALDILHSVKEEFRFNYSKMLTQIIGKHSKVALCTIYNKVPEITNRAVTALALFNEIILEELSRHRLPIIDLRVLFNDIADYSPISPIEPSVHGGRKIVNQIERIIENDYSSKIYV